MSDNDSHSGWTDDDNSTGWDTIPRVPKNPSLSHPQPDPELLKTYYTIYAGLLNGSSSRHALPLELVRIICQLAGFENWHATRAPKGRKSVRTWEDKVKSRVWFQTEPFTKQTLNHIKSAQLVTISRHQGWVDFRNAGSWSWFELQVARPTEQDTGFAKVKRRPSGDRASWRCLEHPVDAETAKLQEDFGEHEGDLLGSDHEIWGYVEEGDVLQVVMKAQQRAWSNTVTDGILKVNTWWEPSLEMLKLM
ncbi:unnamed protein product [Rhizoctonia solani]|uniref:Uncharacterized protein n=1 Tax=Rhizoctonia solani TaxID=456999 RepID=A0A8H3DJH0_9AGAM|nr:unnamed protein product [Rhizoctonia solani]